MAEPTNPGELPKVSPQELLNADISPDGGIIQTSAKTGSRATPSAPVTEKAPSSIKDLPPSEEGKAQEKPAEEADEKVIDFNEFLAAKGNELPIKTKVEDKKSEESKAEPLSTTPNAQTIKTGDKPPERDYSDFSQEDVPALRKMSNEAYEAVKKNLKSLKDSVTLEKAASLKAKEDYENLRKQGPQIPESYYEHEQAYLLDPQFRQAVSQANEAQLIYNHWNNQLAAVAQGAKEFEFLDRNPQTGQLMVTGKIQADNMSEHKLQQYINHSQNLVTNTQARVQAEMQTFGTKQQSVSKSVKDFEAATFSAFDKPDNKPVYEPLIKAEMDRFKAFSKSPLASVLAKSLVMNQALAKLLQEAAAQRGVQGNGQQQQQQVKSNAAGPSGEEAAADGGGGKSGQQEVNFDDFKKVKQGI